MLKPIQINEIMVDLDGVLVNFDRGIFEIIKEYAEDKKMLDILSSADQENVLNMNKGLKKESDIRMILKNKSYKDTVRILIFNNPKWWEELHMHDDGQDLWDYFKQYNPIILTSSFGRTNSDPGKRKWVHKHLGVHVKCIIINEKGELANHDCVLIDDRREIAENFIEAGGNAILHVSTDKTIEEFEKRFSFLEESLKFIKSYNNWIKI